MNLSELLKNLRTEEIIGGTDVEITGLSTDSRLTKSGNLFFWFLFFFLLAILTFLKLLLLYLSHLKNQN